MSDRQIDGTLPGDNDDMAMQEPGDRMWLKLARESFDHSTDFIETGVRREWEDSLSRFRSEHPSGSKYASKSYKSRSKIFRPKTRSAERRALALAAKALFSNSDLIDVRGQNKGDAIQAASARVNKELIQYRLEHTIPWFLTAMGARQDTFNYGVCVSLQTWKYEEAVDLDLQPLIDINGNAELDEEGRELGEEIETRRIVKDEPVLDLIPPENLRIDPNADWRNPVEDSPVVTIMLPMYAHEVLERMVRPNPVTQQPEWREYTLAEILTASDEDDTTDTIGQARQGDNRQDPANNRQYNEYGKVWVHLHIARKDGRDYAYYTLSGRLMLTDPVPAEQLLPLGRDSLTVGISIIESHKVYPIGGNALAAPLQSEINDIANQRMDNVKLALNKRFILRRGAQVDQSALMRSTPGGGVTAGDPEKDVRVMEYNDVTSSSYQEHDRLAQEQDELMGTFSGSSVQANRSLNETVGGMNLLQGDAMSVAELELRTWIESWVEPVLRKLQRLEAMFETDATILQIAGENSEVFQKYGKDTAIDMLIDQDLSVSVNVGMGNTDPVQRVQKFSMVLSNAAQIPEVAQRMKGDEVGKELFALGGYSEGERFFLSDEEWQQKQQQEAEAAAAQQQTPPDSSLQVAQMKMESDMQLEQIRSRDRNAALQVESELARERMQVEGNLKVKDLYEKIAIEKAKNQTQRDKTALTEGNKRREMKVKRDMGSGI